MPEDDDQGAGAQTDKAAKSRKVPIAFPEDLYEWLRLETAEEVLRASVPANFRDETLARLGGRELSDSQQRLIFNYKLAFEGQI